MGSHEGSRAQPLHVRVLTDIEPAWLPCYPPVLNPLTVSVASQQYRVHSISQRKKLRLRKEKEVSRVT